MDYDEFQAEVQRLKAKRWAKILNAEPSGRPPGRRPRDPEQERILIRRSRNLLLQREREAPNAQDPPSD